MRVDPASLRIVSYPDPVLRVRAEPIESIDETVRAVAERMIELMHEAAGVGLAGPQVGLPWRLFVTNAPDIDPVDRVFVNPRVTLGRGAIEAKEEGCLSLPGINVQVRRPVEAEVTATDLAGRPFTMQAEGMLARIWQHENDHLDGVMIIDRMGTMDRLATRKLLKGMKADTAMSERGSRAHWR